jgi:hypothetical protein
VPGICLALVVRAVIFFPVILVINDRVVHLSPLSHLRALLPSATAGLVMAAACGAASALIPGDSFTRHVATAVCGTAAGLGLYAGILMLFFRRDVLPVIDTARQALRRRGQDG